ncbi:ATP-binding protein [Schlesneria sp. T3-172]|uniref:PAS domain-containing sensor histidine kinase n=1 Tax=Schlesneria sphaerica TaxID=3373610 RepID=UPI0037CA398B
MSNKTRFGQSIVRPIDNYVFRAIADYTYDWESWLSPEGKLLWVNAAVERITGYHPDECLQMPDYPLSMVAEEDRHKIIEMLNDATTEGSRNDVEFQLIHRDGSRRWAAVSWQPMYDDSHRHLGHRASVRDITERHYLREELRLHNQHLEQLVQERTIKIAQLEQHRRKMEKLAALGQMAAGIAHEINNPLAGIRNAFALFKGNLSGDDENYELLELIDSEIERISSITHQMYQLYRPSQQSPTRFDLIRAIENVLLLLQPLASEANVRVVLRPPPKDASADPSVDSSTTDVVLRESELRQILLNIVRNAIQASPSQGEVVLDVFSTDQNVTITVTDQGEGISKEATTRIFEPFFSTKTGTRQGMGLGLSVSRSLVEAMGGSIAVERSGPGGTTFQVTLPRRISSHE